jgi:peptidyl-tRNA hydrolase, PTH2 family
MEPKQVIVMRKDLNMRKGKQIAQGAHASMKVLLDRCSYVGFGLDKQMTFLYDKNSDWDNWLEGKFTKIVVSCDSEEELLELYSKAKSKNLPCSLITDAGLTEFNGVPTNTCIAIGPAKPDIIDEITGHLKLL